MSLPTRGTSSPPEVHELLDKLAKAQNDTQQQLADLQRVVTEAQADATKKVVQKLEEERGFQFRKKGNEKQFRFNQTIAQHIDTVKGKSQHRKCGSSDSQASGLHTR